jgi:hypothetical protein
MWNGMLRWVRATETKFGAIVLALVGNTAAATGWIHFEAVNVLKADLIPIENHFVRIERYAGSGSEVRVDNRASYDLLITADIEAREEQLGPGAAALWKCDHESATSLMSIQIGELQPITIAVGCGQRIKVTETLLPL